MTRSAAVKLAVLSILAILTAGYVVAVVLTNEVWGDRDGTRLTFAAQTPEGAAPSADAMSRTVAVLGDRLAGHGYPGSHTRTVDGKVVATVPGRDVSVDEMRDVFDSGQLYIRPVMRAVPIEQVLGMSGGSATRAPQDLATAKMFRQSAAPIMQVQALIQVAAACGDPDPLAGHDDPALPLVTCSTTDKTVYLLGPSILDGSDVRRATSHFDEDQGQYVLDVHFGERGANIWESFTAANIGTQTAFTVDTRVVSAPVIREAIPGGTTQITGTFTADTARQLASTLTAGALPVNLTFESATAEKVGPSRLFLATRAAVIVAGYVLVTLVAATVVYLVWQRRQPEPQAALVTRYTS